MTAPEAKQLSDVLSPLIRLEIASIGAIESVTQHEPDAGYVMLLHETKTSKQANVEQMNTVLRVARQRQVESGGVIEPVLRLQTLALQKASTTMLLLAMRVVEQCWSSDTRRPARNSRRSSAPLSRPRRATRASTG
jgi:hypothetical protein